MRAGPARRVARRMMAGLSVLALAACDPAADRHGNVVVANDQAAAPAADLQINTADRIEPLNAAASPTPAAAPAARMQLHKAFTDPPLPAELNDDGGLKPLPPRPHPGG
jgi:hypothetical protein